MISPDRSSEFALVLQLRNRVKGVGDKITAETANEYQTIYQRMEKRQEGPDDATSRPAYYLRRAALIYVCSVQARQAFRQRDQNTYGSPEWSASMVMIERLSNTLDAYPPDQGRKHHAIGSTSQTWQDVRICKQADGWKAPCKSKKVGLGALVKRSGWADTLIEQISPGYRAALSVALLTGARPAEIQSGIEIRATEEGLEITIPGAKLGEQRGQPERTLLISLESKAAKHLVALANGGTVKVQANAKRFCDATRSAGKRAFPGLRSSVSPYTLRHVIASSLKAAGVDSDGIAQVLGHRATRSQQSYGLACHGKQASSILGVRASLPIKNTERCPTTSRRQSASPWLG